MQRRCALLAINLYLFITFSLPLDSATLSSPSFRMSFAGASFYFDFFPASRTFVPLFYFQPPLFFSFSLSLSLEFVYIYAIIFNECAPVLLTKPSYCINLGFSFQRRGLESCLHLFRRGSAQSSASEALPSNPSRACGLYWRSRRRQVILIRPYSSG